MAREIHFPAEFISNPDQTHLHDFVMILKTLISSVSVTQVCLIMVRAQICREVDLAS